MASVEQDTALYDDDDGEVTCFVCYEYLTEPVVFPCGHEVCQSCFHKNLNAANFYCPICRQRISSWARRRVGNPVDERRKKELERQRKDGTASDPPRCRPHRRVIANTGELHEEYLKELRQVQKEREVEEELGRAEAVRLAASVNDNMQDSQVEMDSQFAAMLAERIAQEELLRKEQEEKDRNLARSLDHSILPPSVKHKPTPSRTAIGKTVKSTKKKKKGEENQLPITVWCTPRKKEDDAQIKTDYELALKLQQSWQSKND